MINTNKKAYENNKNILSSLEYLINEAQRSGFESLSIILIAALTFIRTNNADLQGYLEIEKNDDTKAVIQFLIEFIERPKKVQHDIMNILSNTNLLSEK